MVAAEKLHRINSNISSGFYGLTSEVFFKNVFWKYIVVFDVLSINYANKDKHVLKVLLKDIDYFCSKNITYHFKKLL